MYKIVFLLFSFQLMFCVHKMIHRITVMMIEVGIITIIINLSAGQINTEKDSHTSESGEE